MRVERDGERFDVYVSRQAMLDSGEWLHVGRFDGGRLDIKFLRGDGALPRVHVSHSIGRDGRWAYLQLPEECRNGMMDKIIGRRIPHRTGNFVRDIEAGRVPDFGEYVVLHYEPSFVNHD